MDINWTDPECNITPHFKVKEALTLHNWGRLATKDDGYVANDIIETCQMLEKIRDFLGCPLNIHCIYRSPKYNLEIGAPQYDVHSLSMAADFDASPTYTIQEVQDKLLPQLEDLNIRMETNTPTWTHCDWRMPGPSGRHFIA